MSDVSTTPIRARGLNVSFDGTTGPLNAITDVAAETMTGQNDHTVHAIDHAALLQVMKQYGR